MCIRDRYWTGSAWAALPAAGVSANTEVKYDTTLGFGTWYWAATTKDEWGDGYRSDARAIRIVPSLTALEGYSLIIANEVYEALELNITESANGELSLIEGRLRNFDGELKDKITYGANVFLTTYDAYGNELLYIGRIHSIDTDDLELSFVATMGDKILTDRFCSNNYTNQDLGTVLRGIVSVSYTHLDVYKRQGIYSYLVAFRWRKFNVRPFQHRQSDSFPKP